MRTYYGLQNESEAQKQYPARAKCDEYKANLWKMVGWANGVLILRNELKF
jgi:hypothetical protein